MAFWSDTSLVPKRSYRYRLSIAGGDTGLTHFLIKKVTRPSFEVTETPHKYLNHTFYFPGKMEWGEISFTIVDAEDPNAAKELLQLLRSSGYVLPYGTDSGIDDHQTISKAKSTGALGKVEIQQLVAGHAPGNNRQERQIGNSPRSSDVVETWALQNAWIKSVNFGELDYDSEDLLNIEVTLRYDFAQLSAGPIAFGNTELVSGFGS